MTLNFICRQDDKIMYNVDFQFTLSNKNVFSSVTFDYKRLLELFSLSFKLENNRI
jgi:hypothetical protein